VCCGIGNSQESFLEGADLQCKACDRGLYGDGSGTTCVALCPAGQYMSGGACQLCPVGTFRATPGASNLTDCVPCEPNAYSTVQGASACQLCPAGHYFLDNACPPCPIGTFRATPGAANVTECAACPLYSYSPFKGATACTTCAANF